MTKRRKFSTSFKKQVALAALRGDKTIQELAAHHRLHPNQISQWKRQAVDGLDGVFTATPARIPPLTDARDMWLAGNQEL